jgi:hypothetical protein
MADTARTRAQLIVLLADNVTGQISAQDARDFLVTVMPAEFVNPADFWQEPLPANLTTDKSGRGMIWYSQTAGSTISAGDVVYLHTSNVWKAAHNWLSTTTGLLALALNSYASNATDMEILLEGLWYDSALSVYSAGVGRPFYLCSTTSAGEFSQTRPTGPASVHSQILLGFYLSSYYFRFKPQGWSVIG